MRGNDTIDGGGGYDLLRVEEDADMILSDTVLLAVGYAVNFAALENIDLAGGPGNNILDASAVTAASGLSLRLIGRAGDDVLIGGRVPSNSSVNRAAILLSPVLPATFGT